MIYFYVLIEINVTGKYVVYLAVVALALADAEALYKLDISYLI
jgi:hypothetical protein